jgi:type VI secretion system protein ImpE
MDARQLLEGGDPLKALDALKGEVRKSPRQATLRTFLFQMFCIFGEWDRALTQLTVAAELDPAALPMAETYRNLIRCEMLREGVFAGSRTPTVFGHPLAWVPLLLEANRALAGGADEAAAKLRDEAFEQADTVAGTMDGTPFEWIADADPRLGPVLEAMLDGAYYWVPLQHVSAIHIDPPVDLRDQVWLPVDFTWINGGKAVGFIPTRYPGSATAADKRLALGRLTEWVPRGEHWDLGIGQRMFTTGG